MRDAIQAADVLFGSDAHPHDYLHEVLFRLVAVTWIAAASQNLVNKVFIALRHPHALKAPLVIAAAALYMTQFHEVAKPAIDLTF